jgi:histidinol-phosphate aminotransferase
MASFPSNLFRSGFVEKLQNISSNESLTQIEDQNIILLDENENPFDEVFTYNRNPEAFQHTFRSTFCTYYNVLPSQIVLNRNVSDHLLRIFLLTSAQKESSILFVGPTPPEYKKMAELAGVQNYNFVGKDPFVVDEVFVNQIHSQQKPNVIVLSSPNHYTGQALRTDTINEICTSNPQAVVIVDESLFEYTDAISAISLLDEVDNLVILRSFSHFWGMAGVGISLAISHSNFTEVLQSVTSPYVVDSQSLSYIQHIADTYRKSRTVFHTKTAVITERDRLIDFFESLPIVNKIYPSDANFLLISFKKDSEEVYNQLLEQKIAVHFCKEEELRTLNCLRISVGTPVDNTVLIDVFSSMI